MSSLLTGHPLTQLLHFSLRRLAQLPPETKYPTRWISLCDLLSLSRASIQLLAVQKEKKPQGQAWTCTWEQTMSQTAVSERPPISSPFQWGSCQTITADTHHNSLGENQYWKRLHKLITTCHWPWGGSAVPKPYLAEICLTCCYKHWKVRMLGSAEAWHSSSPSSSLQHLSGVTGLLFVMSYPLWPLNR